MADRAEARVRQERGQWPGGLVLGAMLAAIPVTLLAQDDGGVRLTFSVDGRLEARSNAALDPNGGEAATETVARLGFGLSSETRAARLAFDATGQLRQILTGPDDLAEGFVNPDLRLSYTRSSADAVLDAGLFWRETDLARGRDPTDPLDPLDPVDPDDFDLSAGERREAGSTLSLRWGETGRLGFGLSADYTDTDYSGGSTEPNRTRLNLGASMRLDLSEAATLTFDLTGSRFDSDAAAPRTTIGLDTGLSVARPDGTLRLGLTLDDTEDGLRSGLSLSRNHERPAGGYGYRLGAARDADGDLRLTGGLNLAQDLPRGRLTADLSRDLATASDDDTDRVVTRLILGLSQELTPRTLLSLSGGYSESLNPADDSFTRNLDAGATLSHELGQDWSLDGGISYRARDTDDEGRADDTTLFLGLRRTFEARY